MDSGYIIGWLIGVFFLLLFFVVFSKPLKFIENFCINAIIGISTLLTTNFLLQPIGITVGINIYTIIIAGILSFPGTILLYALEIFIK